MKDQSIIQQSGTMLFYRSLYLIALPALLIWVSLLYQTGLNGPFTFDDLLVFPSTQLSSINYESVMQTLTMHGSGILRRPVSILSLIANGQLLDFSPGSYKLVNLLIHILNTVLVFLLVRILLNCLNDQVLVLTKKQSRVLIALGAAAIWSCHPLQVSTVLYAFQRHVVLSTFFTILALLCYLNSRSSHKTGWVNNFRLFILFPAFMMLAVFSKESGILIILFVILFELIIFRGKDIRFNFSNSRFLFFFLFIFLPSVLALLYLVLNIDSILSAYSSRTFTLAERLMTQPLVLLYYLKMMLFPDLGSMTFYHDNFPVQRSFNIFVVASTLILALLLSGVWILRNRLPIVSLGIGIYLAAHVMESTFIPLELVFEHRNYFALLGVALIVANSIFSLYAHFEYRRYAILASAICLISISGLTYSRNIEWSNEVVLSTVALNENPDSLRVQMLYARTLSNHGMHDKSVKYIDSLYQTYIDDPTISILRAALYCSAGLPVSNQLLQIAELLDTRELGQDVPTMLNQLRKMADRSQCYDVTHESVSNLYLIAAENPKLIMPKTFATSLFATNAQYAMSRQDVREASRYINLALATAPDHPELLIARVSLSLEKGDLVSAEKYLSQLKNINRRKFNAYGSAYLDLSEKVSMTSTSFSFLPE